VWYPISASILIAVLPAVRERAGLFLLGDQATRETHAHGQTQAPLTASSTL
jgi:hypothetical protein